MYVDPRIPRDIFGWHSPRLDLPMPIVRYGDWGRPLLLLPTAQADFLEYERFYLIKSIEHHILAGRVQVFSINSINEYAWMKRGLPPAEAARRQSLFSGYLEEEVIPHIRRSLRDPSVRVAVSGASFGAFYAANAFFRRPDLFGTLIAMSGFYDLGPDYLDGFMNDDVYFNNPLSYLPNVNDHGVLEEMRHHSQIHIVTGQGAYEHPEASRRLSRVLNAKSIPHNLDLWGHDVKHDWPTWRQMLDYYIGHKLGWLSNEKGGSPLRAPLVSPIGLGPRPPRRRGETGRPLRRRSGDDRRALQSRQRDAHPLIGFARGALAPGSRHRHVEDRRLERVEPRRALEAELRGGERHPHAAVGVDLALARVTADDRSNERPDLRGAPTRAQQVVALVELEESIARVRRRREHQRREQPLAVERDRRRHGPPPPVARPSRSSNSARWWVRSASTSSSRSPATILSSL